MANPLSMIAAWEVVVPVQRVRLRAMFPSAQGFRLMGSRSLPMLRVILKRVRSRQQKRQSEIK